MTVWDSPNIKTRSYTGSITYCMYLLFAAFLGWGGGRGIDRAFYF